MKNVLFIALAGILFFSSCNAQNSKVYEAIEYAQYEQALEKNKPLIIDVRTPQEYHSGHIPNAQNINFNDAGFRDQISQLDKQKPVYIYCRSGARSRHAGKIMEEAGFEKVIDLKGGVLTWKGKLEK